jgi:hypothetical protein
MLSGAAALVQMIGWWWLAALLFRVFHRFYVLCAFAAAVIFSAYQRPAAATAGAIKEQSASADPESGGSNSEGDRLLPHGS